MPNTSLQRTRRQSLRSFLLAAELDIVRQRMTVIVWSAFGVMAVAGILHKLAFGQVVEIEFTQFHEQWLKDGKPVGGPKSRSAASFWRSDFATMGWEIRLPGFSFSKPGVYQRWLAETPEWARQSPDAMKLLVRARLWLSVMYVGFAALIGVLIFAGVFGA